MLASDHDGFEAVIFEWLRRRGTLSIRKLKT